MNQALITLVRQRARECCETCRLPQAHSAIPFEIDHIIAKKHGGPTAEDNLALACFFCNSAKGPNIAGLDPSTRKLAPLFNPRRQTWSRHFHWSGPYLVGNTRAGRTTIAVLAINDPVFIAVIPSS
jgi:5-methylcytosine-specific restriction endonuclease McrA